MSIFKSSSNEWYWCTPTSLLLKDHPNRPDWITDKVIKEDYTALYIAIQGGLAQGCSYSWMEAQLHADGLTMREVREYASDEQ